MSESLPGHDSIQIETVFNASPEKVWQAWTDPAVILSWFGSDPHGRGISAEIDNRPGGSFQITFVDSDQTEHTCSGIYKNVTELQKLEFTWNWRSEPGVESYVTVILNPDGQKTKMIFIHSKLGTNSRHNYLDGWHTTFLKLKQHIGQ